MERIQTHLGISHLRMYITVRPRSHVQKFYYIFTDCKIIFNSSPVIYILNILKTEKKMCPLITQPIQTTT